MATPQEPQARATEYAFPGVAALGGPHAEIAAARMRDAYLELQAAGADVAVERLLEIDRVASRRDFATLEVLAVSDPLLEDLSEVHHARVRRILGWRNSVALVPLLLTWLFLGWASLLYQRQLASDPGLATRPFLVLWEQRFGGRFVPTFSGTALTAFAFLTIVLLLTIRAHRVETRMTDVQRRAVTKVDTAISALTISIERANERPPISAQEW